MNVRFKYLLRMVLPVLTIGLIPGFAQKGPQDNWVVEADSRMANITPGVASSADGLLNGPWGIAADTNALYVADANNRRVQVLSLDGTFIRKWGSHGGGDLQFSLLRGIAVDADHVYTMDAANQRVQVFTKEGAFVTKWGSGGTGIAQFSSPFGIAVDDQFVYVADTNNHRVQVFTKAGAYVRHWGGLGDAAGQFNTPYGIGVDHQYVYVMEVFNNTRVQVFTKEGAFVRSWSQAGGGTTSGNGLNIMNLAVDTHNVYLSIAVIPCAQCGSIARVLVYDKFGVLQTELNGAPFSLPGGIAAGNPFLYVADSGSSMIMPVRRIFRTLGSPTLNAIPLSEVLGVSQRPGTAIVDVDYRATDPDNPLLTVHAAAFVATNTVPRLTELIPMRTLVEGTASHLGTNVTAGATHRLSWDMEADDVADRIGDAADVKFAILASDGRPMLDLHFLSLPAVGARPAGVINRAPLVDADFLPAWFWLVAANDPGIEFHQGSVYQAGSARSILFAQGTSTTAAGREFLYAKMNVRAATPDEYTHAREATTPGAVTMRDPRRSPPAAGTKVNEFNFVTSPTNGFWVVPLAP